MTKHILIVLVGSLIAWYAVVRFMSSTDHMPATFTIDHAAHIARKEQKKQAAKQETVQVAAENEPVLNANSVPASQQIARSNVEGPASLANRNAQVSATARLTDEQRGFTIQSEQVEDVQTAGQALEPLNNVRRLPANDSDAELTVQSELIEPAEGELQVEQQNQPSVAVRQDSDVDMQELSATEEDNRVATASNITRPTIDRTSPRNTVTVQKKAETVTALNIAYALPTNTDCTAPSESYPQVDVLYRPSSFAIKGQSLSSIDQLIRLHRKCNGGKFIVLNNETDEKNVDERLIGLRQDEVKYYLLQRRIPKDDIIFSDKL